MSVRSQLAVKCVDSYLDVSAALNVVFKPLEVEMKYKRECLKYYSLLDVLQSRAGRREYFFTIFGHKISERIM